MMTFRLARSVGGKTGQVSFQQRDLTPVFPEGGRELALQCDALARKYFVDPAPEVAIVSPAFEARRSKSTTPHVTIRVEAQARDERRIVRYRWFIDNRLVAETTEPQFIWDIRVESSGMHFVTVHAVDDGWNRDAAQILVRCE